MAVLLSACEDVEPDIEPPADQVFAGVPVPPRSVLLSQTGTAATAQMEVFVPISSDSAANWYRRMLLEQGWTLEGDVATSAGSYTMHARRDGPPLWLMVKPVNTSTMVGTQLTIIGALPDSLRPAGPRETAD